MKKKLCDVCFRVYNQFNTVGTLTFCGARFRVQFNTTCIWMLTFLGGYRYGGGNVPGGPPDVRVRADAECRGGQ